MPTPPIIDPATVTVDPETGERKAALTIGEKLVAVTLSNKGASIAVAEGTTISLVNGDLASNWPWSNVSRIDQKGQQLSARSSRIAHKLHDAVSEAFEDNKLSEQEAAKLARLADKVYQALDDEKLSRSEENAIAPAPSPAPKKGKSR